MNLKNPTNFSPYEIIYFFIYYNYITKKFNGSSEHSDYIEHNIGGLSAEEKESLFLLILKKISQDNFVNFVQSGSEFKEVKIRINFLIQILSLMGSKYLNTFIRNFKKLLDDYIKIKIPEKDKWFYIPYINRYINLIKTIINSNSPDNSSKSSIQNSSIGLNTTKFKNLIQKIGLDYSKINFATKTYGNDKKSLSLAIKKTLLEVHSNKLFFKTNSNKLRERIEYVKQLENILSSSGNKRKSRNNSDNYYKRRRKNNNSNNNNNN
jgi:hypothetical protein